MKRIVEKDIEEHSLSPFIPDGAIVLMLGSFPPAREKWGMNFYYPNFQNDMWRIIGRLFFHDVNHFLYESRRAFDKDRIQAFLTEKKIAVGDSATKVRRLQDNASDKFLEVVERLDILSILQKTEALQYIITTGEKSAEVVSGAMHINPPSIGKPVHCTYFQRDITIFRVPSSSRAYPLSIDKKTQEYKKVFQTIFPDIL